MIDHLCKSSFCVIRKMIGYSGPIVAPLFKVKVKWNQHEPTPPPSARVYTKSFRPRYISRNNFFSGEMTLTNGELPFLGEIRKFVSRNPYVYRGLFGLIPICCEQ